MLLLITDLLAQSEQGKVLTSAADDFNCVLDMTLVRGFYRDNVIECRLAQIRVAAPKTSSELPRRFLCKLELTAPAWCKVHR